MMSLQQICINNDSGVSETVSSLIELNIEGAIIIKVNKTSSLKT